MLMSASDDMELYDLRVEIVVDDLTGPLSLFLTRTL
jgi:hypothetical protein